MRVDKMVKIMMTFTHDFKSKWELEAHLKRDHDDFMMIKDKLLELGMISAKRGILFNQKDKYRHTGFIEFKDVKSYEKCMKLLKGTDWDEEIARVNRYEGYIIDSEV